MVKYYKMIFLVTTILGTLITISSYSWFSMWIGLEINLLSVIPLFSDLKNKFPSEAAFKYFIIQSMASTLLMFSLILNMNMLEQMDSFKSNFSLLTFYISILTKLGAAPFHSWFPEVIDGLSWLNSMLLLTWQKIAPMMILMQNFKLSVFIIFIIIISSLIGGMIGLNQISLRKILAYSSINHIAWMLTSMISMKMIWLIYFLVYSLISFTIILSLKITKTFFIHQISIFKDLKILSMMINLNFLSLGGLPPFLGFFPKWLTINFLMYQNNFLLMIILIMTTLISLYIYTRILFSAITILSNESSIKMTKTKNYFMFLMNFTTLFSLMACPTLMNSF